MFTTFPYSNFQNLNLDWILKQVKEIPETIETSIENALQNVVFKAAYDEETETIILNATKGGDRNAVG